MKRQDSKSPNRSIHRLIVLIENDLTLHLKILAQLRSGLDINPVLDAIHNMLPFVICASRGGSGETEWCMMYNKTHSILC